MATWKITSGPDELRTSIDGRMYSFTIQRDGEMRRITVEISGTAQVSTLIEPLDEIVRTHGRWAVDKAMRDFDYPPPRIKVNSRGWNYAG